MATCRLFAIDQPVQQIEHMRLGRRACFQRQLHGTEHRLLVVLQHQRQDLHHLPVATRALEQDAPAAAGTPRQLDERRAVPQRAGLALHHRQVVPPVVDRPARQCGAAVDDPRVLAQDWPSAATTSRSGTPAG